MTRPPGCAEITPLKVVLVAVIAVLLYVPAAIAVVVLGFASLVFDAIADWCYKRRLKGRRLYDQTM
tara:strand:- start:945 stop:1142 length:198 start_codon:yes stop_codon:yes gene_type:complete